MYCVLYERKQSHHCGNSQKSADQTTTHRHTYAKRPRRRGGVRRENSSKQVVSVWMGGSRVWVNV